MAGGKLAELYVDLVAHDKLGPAIQQAKDMIGRTQAELAQISTAGGQARLKEFVDSQKKAAASHKELSRAIDIGINGRFNVFMKDMGQAINKAGEALSGFGMGPLGNVIVGLGAMNAMQQASPDIWNTFTGSINYAAAGLGTALMPMLIELSRWLQGVARWFLDLDDGTKAMIGGFAKWAAIIGTVGFALSKIIGVIQGVSAALRALATANPWLLLAAGLGALISIVAGASMFGGSGEAFSSSGGELRAIREGRLNPTRTREDRTRRAESLITALHEGEYVRGGRYNLVNPGGTGDYAGVNAHDLRRNLSRILGSDIMARPEMEAIIERGRLTGRASSRIEYTPEMRDSIAALIRTMAGESADTAIRGSIVNSAMRQYLGGTGPVRGVEGALIGRLTDAVRAMPSLAALIPERGSGTPLPGGGRRLLHDAHFQSQFLGIEQQWMSMQQGAASMTPLQAEMLNIQREQRDYLFNIDRTTDARLPRPAL